MMLELGVLLAAAPTLLNNLWVSAALLAVAVGVTALAAWFTREGQRRAAG
jgi:hypothetical protein